MAFAGKLCVISGGSGNVGSAVIQVRSCTVSSCQTHKPGCQTRPQDCTPSTGLCTSATYSRQQQYLLATVLCHKAQAYHVCGADSVERAGDGGGASAQREVEGDSHGGSGRLTDRDADGVMPPMPCFQVTRVCSRLSAPRPHARQADPPHSAPLRTGFFTAVIASHLGAFTLYLQSVLSRSTPLQCR